MQTATAAAAAVIRFDVSQYRTRIGASVDLADETGGPLAARLRPARRRLGLYERWLAGRRWWRSVPTSG